MKYLGKLFQDETYVNLWKAVEKKTRGRRVIIILTGLIVTILLAYLISRQLSWPAWTGLGNKTAWDLLALFLVPAVLIIVTWIFTKHQTERDKKVAKQQKQRDAELAKQARERDKEIAREQTQEAALQNYLDKMAELLMPPNNLRQSYINAEVRNIGRSRTLTVLLSLDADRKGTVVQFLYVSGLIDIEDPIIDLAGASLFGTNLTRTNLAGADLSGADLTRAQLTLAQLSEVNLEGADLTGAYIESAELTHANLAGADLTGTNLADADLKNANLAGALLLVSNMEGADLGGANAAGANLKGANLKRAKLANANLTGANLSDTDLGGAFMLVANLSSVDLKGANLEHANLKGAKLVDVIFDSSTKWPAGFDPHSTGTQYQ
jgi:uncharacterized protein YjbI with pentapeptide repeats